MQTDQLSQKLDEGLMILQLNRSPEIQNKLLKYVKILIEWNTVYNLTAITNPVDILVKHILDSLSISSYLIDSSILDVGSGAGLPGIPLAIINPDKKFVLLDSNAKKRVSFFMLSSSSV